MVRDEFPESFLLISNQVKLELGKFIFRDLNLSVRYLDGFSFRNYSCFIIFSVVKWNTRLIQNHLPFGLSVQFRSEINYFPFGMIKLI
jgi:hypothetical protein